MAKSVQKKRSKRHLEFSSIMPVQFHLLCKLMEVEHRKVIYDFMSDAGMESYGLGDTQRAKAMEYLIDCGYGEHHYTQEATRQIFKEMESISSLFPDNGKSKLVDFHARWRNKYYKYWFRKWYRKVRLKE